MEDSEKSSAEEFDAEKKTAGRPASDSEKENSVSGLEGEGKKGETDPTSGGGNDASNALAVVGGYNSETPPHDDCCPICFDAFDFPCKTSCGHWFCSSCILRHWKYTADIKQCKCPICGFLITRLVPHSSSLTGRNAVKILNDINRYNRLNVGGWRSLFLKALVLPLFLRRSLRPHLDPGILRCILQGSRLIGMLLAILYQFFGFHFFPAGGPGIQMLFDSCALAVVLFLVVDVLLYRWRLRRRARRLAQVAVVQQLE